jgi:hypothetical protein
MNYRNLTKDEIAVLQKNSCNADNWNKIFVSEKFKTELVKNVNFLARYLLVRM